MYQLAKSVLFRMAPERAHEVTLKALAHLPLAQPIIKAAYGVSHTALRRQLFGLEFPNPVGLAAGFDKDGKHYRAMSSMGFGFLEIGTVTPRPQAGNPRPRLFRLPTDEALINRMGFNNDGLDALVARLKRHRATPRDYVLGGNIGKNKDTPNSRATEDYERCFEALFEYVDYFVVNVSSPNTPGLRELQDREPLTRLLLRLQALNRQQAQPKPLLLKIAPDLTDTQLDDIIAIAGEAELSGLIATNTTIDRSGLTTSPQQVTAIGNGGLSGAPLRHRATEVVRYISHKTRQQLPIIAVGGILSGADALEKIQAGASLLQVYTGLVYRGPALIREINQTLLEATVK